MTKKIVNVFTWSIYAKLTESIAANAFLGNFNLLWFFVWNIGSFVIGIEWNFGLV